MQVSFVAVGDELLRAESREGNGHELAQQLANRGLRLAEMRVLPDDRAGIREALHALTAQPGLVVVSGGLGPTEDDFTREAVALAAGVELFTDVVVALSVEVIAQG